MLWYWFLRTAPEFAHIWLSDYEPTPDALFGVGLVLTMVNFFGIFLWRLKKVFDCIFVKKKDPPAEKHDRDFKRDQIELLQNIDVSLDRIAYYLDQREEVQK